MKKKKSDIEAAREQARLMADASGEPWAVYANAKGAIQVCKASEIPADRSSIKPIVVKPNRNKEAVFLVATLDSQGEPVEPANVQVFAYTEDEFGVRVILGDTVKNSTAPDLLIERAARGGWRVIIHPEGQAEPRGAIFITDQGQTYFIPGDDRPEILNIASENDATASAGVDDDPHGEKPWHCQNCDYHGAEADFWPTDGTPAEHICPKCSSLDTFFSDEDDMKS